MKSEFIIVKGVKTHFTITHPKGIKTLIFLHGWGGSTESFQKISEIIDPNIRMICIDLPGFGKSDFPPKKGWKTPDYADWLHEFLDASKDIEAQNSFYGHSFGCRVLVRFANKNPEKIEKLILTGAAGIVWPPTLKQKTLSSAAKIIKPLLEKPLSQERKTGALLAKIKRKLLRFFGAHDWEKCPKELRPTLTKVLNEEDFREELKNIHHHTLLLWGAKDTYTPLKSAKIYHESLPHNELIVFPKGRHGIHYTETPSIIKLVDEFL